MQETRATNYPVAEQSFEQIWSDLIAPTPTGTQSEALTRMYNKQCARGGVAVEEPGQELLERGYTLESNLRAQISLMRQELPEIGQLSVRLHEPRIVESNDQIQVNLMAEIRNSDGHSVVPTENGFRVFESGPVFLRIWDTSNPEQTFNYQAIYSRSAFKEELAELTNRVHKDGWNDCGDMLLATTLRRGVAESFGMVDVNTDEIKVMALHETAGKGRFLVETPRGNLLAQLYWDPNSGLPEAIVEKAGRE